MPAIGMKDGSVWVSLNDDPSIYLDLDPASRRVYKFTPREMEQYVAAGQQRRYAIIGRKKAMGEFVMRPEFTAALFEKGELL